MSEKSRDVPQQGLPEPTTPEQDADVDHYLDHGFNLKQAMVAAGVVSPWETSSQPEPEQPVKSAQEKSPKPKTPRPKNHGRGYYHRRDPDYGAEPWNLQ